MYFPSGGGDVANSRFIRAMQTGELFQIGESSALAFDLSSACSLILNLLLIPPTPYLSILHQFPSLTLSPLPPPADSLSLSQCGLLGHTHIYKYLGGPSLICIPWPSVQLITTNPNPNSNQNPNLYYSSYQNCPIGP